MTAEKNEPRRVRVKRNIYRRPTGVLEVGFKDASSIQRWRTVDGGIMAARKLHDELLARRGRGETTVTRTVYVHEIADARRRQMRRSRMTAEFAGALSIALQSETNDEPS